jgi:hypothetical protein
MKRSALDKAKADFASIARRVRLKLTVPSESLAVETVVFQTGRAELMGSSGSSINRTILGAERMVPNFPASFATTKLRSLPTAQHTLKENFLWSNYLSQS